MMKGWVEEEGEERMLKGGRCVRRGGRGGLLRVADTRVPGFGYCHTQSCTSLFTEELQTDIEVSRSPRFQPAHFFLKKGLCRISRSHAD